MLSRAALLTIAVVAGCGLDRASDDPNPGSGDHHDQGDGPVRALASALSDEDPVSAAVMQSCTTLAVKGLSTQLIDEIQCLRPGALASIDGAAGLTLGDAVFPWLQTPARQALLDAQKQRGVPMVIDSALRTLPQQYLLFRWFKANRCDIGLAASPGTSNHESALAVDIEDNAGWRSAMNAHDFRWLGASDPVHFDHVGKGQSDIGGLSVLAFQRLWNRNHPDDRIAEDSDYGTATEERLAKSPVGGFQKGAECIAAKEPSPSSPGASSGAPGAPEAPGAPGAAGTRLEAEGAGCAITDCPGNASTALGLAAALAALARRRRRAG